MAAGTAMLAFGAGPLLWREDHFASVPWSPARSMLLHPPPRCPPKPAPPLFPPHTPHLMYICVKEEEKTLEGLPLPPARRGSRSLLPYSIGM